MRLFATTTILVLATLTSHALDLFQPALATCSHVDRKIPMSALQDFEIFVDGIEMSNIIANNKVATVSGSALTKVHGQNSLVPVTVKRRKDGILELSVQFGDGMNSFALAGEFDFAKDQVTVPLRYQFQSSTAKIDTDYVYDCKMGFR